LRERLQRLCTGIRERNAGKWAIGTMSSTPDVPRQLGSAYVLTRFLLRILLLSVFATLGSQGFTKTIESLLVLAVFYCIFAAVIRREAPFGPALTHLDEAAAYAVVAWLVSFMS
jgi:hypothetical protein